MEPRRHGAVDRWEIQAILFTIFLFLYLWPLLTDFGLGRPQVLFFYYYAVLAVHIVALFLLSRRLRPGSRDLARKPSGEA